MTVRIAEREGAALDGGAVARLRARIGAGIARARSTGEEVVVAVTLPADPAMDPSAVVAASRRAGDRWFCFEQPDRNGFALAGLGGLRTLEERGPGRFARVAAAWRRLSGRALSDPPTQPGAGLGAVGGFAFAAEGAAAPAWSSFAPASLTVPEVALARLGEEAQMTLAALAFPDDTVEDVLARVLARLGDLRARPLPLLDPAPAGRYRIAGAMPPEHYESAVARAVERIRAGELQKVVLAREVEVHAPGEHDAAAVLGVLREAFPGCYVFCAGTDEAAFVGASPELLVRRDGPRASTVALAGSAPRSADPAVDDHLGERLLRSPKEREEQAIVAARIERTLRPRSLWVTAPEEPSLVRMANIQHLATPIRVQLAQPIGAIDLAGLLHPTPAVGGEPGATAARLIPALEGLDRGWYAGALGWSDSTEDGEFCVALRCALLRGAVAHCYAGVGVVRDSDPAAELAETEVKLQALLPVLAG
jgi:salicylate biosynthesis isochorismate synthase/menaquinone-specific isochorismate synthase